MEEKTWKWECVAEAPCVTVEHEAEMSLEQGAGLWLSNAQSKYPTSASFGFFQPPKEPNTVSSAGELAFKTSIQNTSAMEDISDSNY